MTERTLLSSGETGTPVRPLVVAMRLLQEETQAHLAAFVAKAMAECMEDLRRQDLRAQLKVKGKPGWKHWKTMPAKLVRQYRQKATDAQRYADKVRIERDERNRALLGETVADNLP